MNSQSSTLRRVVFVSLLFLSGFCGISYEVLYGRMLGNLIGEQFAVSASILLTFMLGIGLGTLYAHRLWRWLWLIEGAIGLYGAAFALGSGAIERWFYSAYPAGGSMAGGMVACLVLLCVPTFLIGCSLPLFAGYLGRFSSGQVFARAYMVYNFGAALTVLLIEFWLLRELGVRRTVVTIAALNGLVSVGLLLGFRDWRLQPENIRQPLAMPKSHLLALALASVGSAIFQLLMIKVSECFLGPFRETFAIVVGLVLLGIAVGSSLVRRWRMSFDWVLVAGLAGLAWLLLAFQWVTWAYAWVHPIAVGYRFTAVLHRAVAVALLMGVPAVAFGATVPALLGEMGSVARNSGRLLCLSSVANAAGFLLMALVLHRWLDYGVLLVVVAGLATLSVLVYARWRSKSAAVSAALMGLVVLLHGVRWDEKLLYVGYDAFQSRRDLADRRYLLRSLDRFKGAQDIFSIVHFGSGDCFFINGFFSIQLNLPPEKVVGAFPALFAPRTDRALVLGVGSGATAGTVAELFGRMDGVEINPVVVQNLHRMAQHNFHLASKSNIQIRVDDGIHFMKVCQEKYPLIINTVTSPRYFSSSKLYTRDFLETVRQRLEPDGIYVTWVDARVGPRGLDIMLKTIAQSFKECWLAGINSGYYLLLCSQQSMHLRHPNLVTSNPRLAGYFRTNGIPPELLPYGLFTTHAYALINNTNVPINTMDYPALEFQIARLDDRRLEHFSTSVREKMNLAELEPVLTPEIKFNPVNLALHALIFYGEHPVGERRRELAAKAVEDFNEQFLPVKFEYYRARAELMNTADAYHEFANESLAQRRYEEAIAAEQKALALNPKLDDAYFNIAQAYERKAEYHLASTNYLNELRVNPGKVGVWRALGRVHHRLKEPARALEYLQRANQVDERAENYLQLGIVLEALGRPKEAEEAYRRGLSLGIKPAEKTSKTQTTEGADSAPRRPTVPTRPAQPQ